jgi:hypothetical protein
MADMGCSMVSAVGEPMDPVRAFQRPIAGDGMDQIKMVIGKGVNLGAGVRVCHMGMIHV